MKRLFCAAVVGAMGLGSGAAFAQDPVDFDPATLDMAKLIECSTYDVPSYNALAFWLMEDGGKAARARFGLTEEPSRNPMLQGYALKAPLTVFGRQTRHIVFTSSGPMAVLDEADPRPLARELGVSAAFDQPGKFLGEREIAASTKKDETMDMVFKTRIALNVSTVTSHPGKVLAGCSYVMDIVDAADAK
jgi:hypothetical protein